MVGLVALVPWLVWRGGLRKWTKHTDVENGCVVLGACEDIAARQWSLAAPETPAVIILEELNQKCWIRGKAPKPRSAFSRRVYSHRCPLARKPYLQRLATLDVLLMEGLPALQPQLPMGYYRFLFSSESPGQVPVLHITQEYNMLSQHGMALKARTAVTSP